MRRCGSLIWVSSIFFAVLQFTLSGAGQALEIADIPVGEHVTCPVRALIFLRKKTPALRQVGQG